LDTKLSHPINTFKAKKQTLFKGPRNKGNQKPIHIFDRHVSLRTLFLSEVSGVAEGDPVRQRANFSSCFSFNSDSFFSMLAPVASSANSNIRKLNDQQGFILLERTLAVSFWCENGEFLCICFVSDRQRERGNCLAQLYISSAALPLLSN
jgi:hypothetical protein